MYRPLAPCTDCRRHVLASASACPFCGSARTPDFEPEPPVFRASRAAAMAFAATMVVAGCHTEPRPAEVQADPAASAVKPVEATPKPIESIPPPAPPPPAPGEVDDHGGMVTKYGAPPPPKPIPTPTPSAKPKTPPVAAYGAPAPTK